MAPLVTQPEEQSMSVQYLAAANAALVDASVTSLSATTATVKVDTVPTSSFSGAGAGPASFLPVDISEVRCMVTWASAAPQGFSADATPTDGQMFQIYNQFHGLGANDVYWDPCVGSNVTNGSATIAPESGMIFQYSTVMSAWMVLART